MKTLTDWFDKVFVINCAHRPDRKERVMKHLAESGMADVAKVVVYTGIIGDYTGHPAGWNAGRGAWGCLQSHRRLMEDLMHMRDERQAMSWNSALILEDDVFFTDDALRGLNEFMLNVPPSWGQLYLGGQHSQRAAPTENPHVVVGTSVNRTHAYALSKHYIQRIYHHVSYMPDYMKDAIHIDHQLELAHRRKDWPVYCPVKWIAGQEAGASNISGKVNERQLWL